MSRRLTSSRADMGMVSRTTRDFLDGLGRKIAYDDRLSALRIPVTLDFAVAPDGLLPSLLVAAEAVWDQATGTGFALELARDDDAPFGHRMVSIGAPFSAVMLSLIDVVYRILPEQGDVVFNDLDRNWHLPKVKTAPSPTVGVPG